MGGLGGGDSGQAGLAQATEPAHAQAQCRVVGQLNGAVTQAHVARDRETGAGLGQSRGVETVLFKQRLWVQAMAAHGIGQAMDEAHR